MVSRIGPSPGVRYSASTLPTVIKIAVWAVDQVAGNDFADWLSATSWGWWIALSVMFLLGQLIADLRNGNSWLRWWITRKLRFAEVQNIWSGTRHVDDRIFIYVSLQARFFRSVRNINVVLIVHAKEHRYSFIMRRNAEFISHQTVVWEIVRVRKDAPLFCWNPDGDEDKDVPIIDDTPGFLAEIQIEPRRLRWRRQKVRLYVGHVEDDLETGGLLYLIEENSDIFTPRLADNFS